MGLMQLVKERSLRMFSRNGVVISIWLVQWRMCVIRCVYISGGMWVWVKLFWG